MATPSFCSGGGRGGRGGRFAKTPARPYQVSGFGVVGVDGDTEGKSGGNHRPCCPCRHPPTVASPSRFERCRHPCRHPAVTRLEADKCPMAVATQRSCHEHVCKLRGAVRRRGGIRDPSRRVWHWTRGSSLPRLWSVSLSDVRGNLVQHRRPLCSTRRQVTLVTTDGDNHEHT